MSENVMPLGEMIIIEIIENIAKPGEELKSESGIIIARPKELNAMRDAYIPKTGIIYAIGPDVPSKVNLSIGDKVVAPTNVIRIQFEDKNDKRFLIATNYKNITVKFLKD